MSIGRMYARQYKKIMLHWSYHKKILKEAHSISQNLKNIIVFMQPMEILRILTLYIKFRQPPINRMNFETSDILKCLE